MKKALIVIVALFAILILMKGGDRKKKDPMAELQTKPVTLCKYVLQATLDKDADKIKAVCDEKTKKTVDANFANIANWEKIKMYTHDKNGPILKMQDAQKTKAYNSYGYASTGGTVCDFEIHLELREDGKWWVTRFIASG